MGPLLTTGLEMPPDFPADAYHAIHLKIAACVETHKETYSEFAGAWNALSYRYKAVAEYDQLFTASIVKHGSGPPHEERYRQERDLFGFFNNGFSIFESLSYAMFAAGSMLQPGHFPLATPRQKRAISVSTTIAAYKAAYPSDSIAPMLDATVKDPSLQELRDIRNVLSHRTAPGRTIQAAIGGPVSDSDRWKLADVILDETTTSKRRVQTTRLFSSVLEAFKMFTIAHF